MTDERSNAQPRHYYQDPAIHCKYESERNKCNGCQHEISVTIAGVKSKGCDKSKKHGHGCTLKGKV